MLHSKSVCDRENSIMNDIGIYKRIEYGYVMEMMDS